MKIRNKKVRKNVPLGIKFILGWILVSVGSLLIGSVIGLIISNYFSCTENFILEVIGIILFGSIIGLTMSFAQSRLLVDILKKPNQWVIANLLGWALAFFLLEMNFPFSQCRTLINGQIYSGTFPRIIWVETFQHNILLLPALSLYELTESNAVYNTAYDLTFMTLAGVCVGLPLGIAHWWSVRKDFRRPSLLFLVNIFTWILGFSGAIYLFDYARLFFLGWGWLFLLYPTMISLTFVFLTKKQIIDNANSEAPNPA